MSTNQITPLTPLFRTASLNTITSRSVPPVRWTTPQVPGVVLLIVPEGSVDPPRLYRFCSGVSAIIRHWAGLNLPPMPARHVPALYEDLRNSATGVLGFEMCPTPPTEAITWQLALEVILALIQYFSHHGWDRIGRFQVLRAGLTPDQDVRVASGALVIGFGPIPHRRPPAPM